MVAHWHLAGQLCSHLACPPSFSIPNLLWVAVASLLGKYLPSRPALAPVAPSGKEVFPKAPGWASLHLQLGMGPGPVRLSMCLLN